MNEIKFNGDLIAEPKYKIGDIVYYISFKDFNSNEMVIRFDVIELKVKTIIIGKIYDLNEKVLSIRYEVDNFKEIKFLPRFITDDDIFEDWLYGTEPIKEDIARRAVPILKNQLLKRYWHEIPDCKIINVKDEEEKIKDFIEVEF